MTAVSNLADFRALDPFFRIIEEGVAGLVDGEHFFDLLAEDVVFEYVITVPGYPRRVEGRQAVAELYRPYGATFFLDRCYDLAVHHDQVPKRAADHRHRRLLQRPVGSGEREVRALRRARIRPAL